MGASIRARLVNLSKQRRQPLDLLLNNYVLERLLHRLSQTKHHDRFILKGAMLLTKWFEDTAFPTPDHLALLAAVIRVIARRKQLGQISFYVHRRWMAASKRYRANRTEARSYRRNRTTELLCAPRLEGAIPAWHAKNINARSRLLADYQKRS
ncbi:hypothetical protein [Bradyrhizobium pachyrhizi]|uniref:hypothetical protein n=1 Tax=Bradyrhizobium pachyrhizi TaxID=280333 RepID=UPI003D364A42